MSAVVLEVARISCVLLTRTGNVLVPDSMLVPVGSVVFGRPEKWGDSWMVPRDLEEADGISVLNAGTKLACTSLLEMDASVISDTGALRLCPWAPAWKVRVPTVDIVSPGRGAVAADACSEVVKVTVVGRTGLSSGSLLGSAAFPVADTSVLTVRGSGTPPAIAPAGEGSRGMGELSLGPALTS